MKTKNRKQYNNRTLGLKSIVDYDIDVAYTKYKKEKLKKDDWIKGRQNLINFTKEYFKVIADNLVESPGGVLVKRLGYFCIWRPPRKMTYNIGQGEVYNHHTDNYIYTLLYIPRSKKKGFDFFAMERAFNDTVKKRVAKKLKSGFRYKNYLYSIKKFLKDR